MCCHAMATTPQKGEQFHSFLISTFSLSPFSLQTMGVVKNTIKAGDGVRFPKRGQTLKKNGKVFDSSIGGDPFETVIGVGDVIRGWDEGVPLLSVGEKATLDITSDYAYGEEGADDDIPPNSDLIFEVELVAIIG
ncbi:hypothetical protein B0O80DRAFT_451770 [Mortierella sp. GBAus27b]|nr:hypothetical protein B0O80DRAFT_451770 [Mortierella sp. GBAus27b]